MYLESSFEKGKCQDPGKRNELKIRMCHRAIDLGRRYPLMLHISILLDKD
jgi:hypothetical protein